MTSALTTRGSTRAWRTIRQAWADQLAHLGTVPCWRTATNTNPSPTCTRTITNGQPWVLGHTTDRAFGGTDHHLGYECVPCSNHTGGKTGALLRKLSGRHTRKPSRQW